MGDVFRCLLHRISAATQHLVEPTSLALLDNISTYASCSSDR